MPELFGEILRYERIETGAAGAAVLSAVLLLGLLIARNVSSGKYRKKVFSLVPALLVLALAVPGYPVAAYNSPESESGEDGTEVPAVEAACQEEALFYGSVKVWVPDTSDLLRIERTMRKRSAEDPLAADRVETTAGEIDFREPDTEESGLFMMGVRIVPYEHGWVLLFENTENAELHYILSIYSPEGSLNSAVWITEPENRAGGKTTESDEVSEEQGITGPEEGAETSPKDGQEDESEAEQAVTEEAGYEETPGEEETGLPMSQEGYPDEEKQEDSRFADYCTLRTLRFCIYPEEEQSYEQPAEKEEADQEEEVEKAEEQQTEDLTEPFAPETEEEQEEIIPESETEKTLKTGEADSEPVKQSENDTETDAAVTETETDKTEENHGSPQEYRENSAEGEESGDETEGAEKTDIQEQPHEDQRPEEPPAEEIPESILSPEAEVLVEKPGEGIAAAEWPEWTEMESGFPVSEADNDQMDPDQTEILPDTGATAGPEKERNVIETDKDSESAGIQKAPEKAEALRAIKKTHQMESAAVEPSRLTFIRNGEMIPLQYGKDYHAVRSLINGQWVEEIEIDESQMEADGKYIVKAYPRTDETIRINQVEGDLLEVIRDTESPRIMITGLDPEICAAENQPFTIALRDNVDLTSFTVYADGRAIQQYWYSEDGWIGTDSGSGILVSEGGNVRPELLRDGKSHTYRFEAVDSSGNRTISEEYTFLAEKTVRRHKHRVFQFFGCIAAGSALIIFTILKRKKTRNR